MRYRYASMLAHHVLMYMYHITYLIIYICAADSCQHAAFPGLTARIHIKIKSEESNNNVYAKVVGNIVDHT